MSLDGVQFLRKVSLFVFNPEVIGNNPSAYQPEKVMDLSGFHIEFTTAQQDEESPNTAVIRIWNLSTTTEKRVREEFTRVVLQAGYQHAAFGSIFEGTIKQFRTGKKGNIDTYLDILAADGDISYNWATVNQSLAAGSSFADRVNAIAKAMNASGSVDLGTVIYPDTGGILPRGKVLFGYAKAAMRQVTQTMGSTWSIQNGKINIIPLDGYLPGEAVILNAQTGLIGRPEQTPEGIKAVCLLNPKIVVGGTVKIDNKSINQTSNQNPDTNGLAPAFNQYAGLQRLASVTADGLYRVYVAEHEGNIRGGPWYTKIICLTVNPVTNKVQPYGGQNG